MTEQKQPESQLFVTALMTVVLSHLLLFQSCDKHKSPFDQWLDRAYPQPTQGSPNEQSTTPREP